VVRLHPEIRAAADQFVRLRIANMRGVDLSIFDFDYDLAWHAFFLNPDGAVLGRFGGRDPDVPGKYHSLKALRHSLDAALSRFKNEAPKIPDRVKPMRAEEYPAASRLSANACIHCHHVHEFRRALLQEEKRWSLDNVWMYPDPENLGVTLDVDRGDRVIGVAAKSNAARAGIAGGDVLLRIDDVSIASSADVQNALHRAPKNGDVSIVWRTGAIEKKATMKLDDGWRKTDVSWRWSLKSLAPNPSIIGDDLDRSERQRLGLDPAQLAFRHMNFLTPPARHAGLQANDIILGIGDQPMRMTARQFETHIRLNYRVGDEITLNVLRGMERIRLKLKLPE
jgi:predicted metalloprotease with PDZ domain